MVRLRTPDSRAYESHPLVQTNAVTIDTDFDEDTDSFVTYVNELHGMSTFGNDEKRSSR